MTPGFFQISLKLFLMRGDELLILRDRASKYGDLPGGRLGETEIYLPFPESLGREIREELGESVRYSLNPEPLFVFPHKMIAGHEALGIAFIGRYEGGEIELSEEHGQMKWENVRSFDPRSVFFAHLLDAVLRFQSEFDLIRRKAPAE